MKKFFFCLFFLNTFNLRSQAQWVLSPDLSADYECTIGTIEEGAKKGKVHIAYTFRDTLFFDVRRTISGSGKKWEIAYEILKTYNIGLFTKEKPNYNPIFHVDKHGKLDPNYYPKEKLSVLDNKIYHFLRLTIFPFPPPSALKDGYTWNAVISSNMVTFEVSTGYREKNGRECFQIHFESEVSALKGEIYLEKNTGKLIYLECTNSTIGEISRLRLSIRNPVGLIDAKMKEYADGEAKIALLNKSYNWLIPLTYHRIQSMSYEIDHRGYIVEQNGHFGWINETGRTILLPSHDMVERAAGQLMYRADGNNICLIDSTNRVLMDSLDENLFGWGPQYHAQPVMRKGKWHVINQQGVVENTYLQSAYALLSGPENDGTMTVYSPRRKFGLIRGNQVVIPVEFNYLSHRIGTGLVIAYKDSTAYIFDSDGNVKYSRKGGEIVWIFDDLYGIQDEGLLNWKTGKFAYRSTEFSSLIQITDRVSIINSNYNQYLLFNKDWQLLGTFKEINLEDGAEFMAASDLKTELFGILDLNGKWLIQPIYYRITHLEKDIFIGVSEKIQASGSVYGLFRINGKTILPLKFNRIWPLGAGKYYIESEDQKGVFNATDSTFMDFSKLGLFNGTLEYEEDRFILINNAGKKGLFDMNLNEIVPIEFSDVGPVTRYGVVVSANGKSGVIKRPKI